MTTSALLRFAIALSTAAAVTACQPAEPATDQAQEPAATGSAVTHEHAEHTEMEHDNHDESGHAAGNAAPAGTTAAADEASGAAEHMDHGGMNMPELGEYDPADWSDQPGAEIGNVTRCPVSGEEFRVTEDSTFFEHNGQKVYFCCPGCIRQFQRNPDALLAAAFPGGGSGE